MPVTCTTDEMLVKVEAVAARLEFTSRRFDRAVERFNLLSPQLDELLTKTEQRRVDDEVTLE